MERLDKNLLSQVALELNLVSLLNFCNSNKDINQKICNNNTFWMNRLFKDYPLLKGKFVGIENVNYKRVYQSLANKEYYTYNLYRSACDTIDGVELPPKFYPYLMVKTKGKAQYWYDDEVYEMTEKLYPDIIGRCGEEFSFSIVGDFPKGFQVWLAYSSDNDLSLEEGFPSKTQAIDKIMWIMNYLLSDVFEDFRLEIEDATGKNMEDVYGNLYGYRNKEDLLKYFRNELETKGYFKYYDVSRDKYDWFMVQGFKS